MRLFLTVVLMYFLAFVLYEGMHYIYKPDKKIEASLKKRCVDSNNKDNNLSKKILK
jgi:hypothetical protein